MGLMDANYQLKITDFGLSFLSEKEQEAIMKTSYVGTRGYQAPELLKKKKYNKKCDIFSAGVVLFILLTGYPPFEQAVKTDKCQALLSKMLAYKPSNRYSIEEIQKDPWYNG